MARRKKLKKKALFSLVVLLVVIAGSLAFCFQQFGGTNNNKDNTTGINDSKNNATIKEEPKDEVYKVSMLATGDALIHNAVYWEYENEDGTYNFDGALDYVRDIVQKYDIAYYNQETPFAGGTPSGYPRFSTPSEFGDAMLKAGFNMVSLATNHTLDKGEKGIINFYNYFKDKDGVIYN